MTTYSLLKEKVTQYNVSIVTRFNLRSKKWATIPNNFPSKVRLTLATPFPLRVPVEWSSCVDLSSVLGKKKKGFISIWWNVAHFSSAENYLGVKQLSHVYQVTTHVMSPCNTFDRYCDLCWFSTQSPHTRSWLLHIWPWRWTVIGYDSTIRVKLALWIQGTPHL